MDEFTAGPTNTLTDVPGIRVGHSQRVGEGWLTGTTVVLTPSSGAVGGVDVRGGGPGTRETDLLDPGNLVDRVHAVVLTGGSALGLASADGVMSRLFAAGVGRSMGEPGCVVPIVPGAVIFDLGRGGKFGNAPGAGFGERAYDAARSSGSGPVRQGGVGAGTGAVAGGLKGGLGSASAVLPDGTTVAALIVANPLGSCVDPRTGKLYGARFGLPGEFPTLEPPSEHELAEASRRADESVSPSGLRHSLATTIGVIATDATLTKSQCTKLAGVAHDGMARAIRPVHSMFDGDTVFAVATGGRPAPDDHEFFLQMAAAADCLSRAVAHAMLAAETVQTRAGLWRSYRDAFPSAFRNGHVANGGPVS